MNSTPFGAHRWADDAVPEDLQNFMTELSRVEAASKSRAQELAQAQATERELSDQVALATYAAQKARCARLQLELDVATTRVRIEEAQRKAAEDRQRLTFITAQLSGVEARSRSLNTMNEEGRCESHHNILLGVTLDKSATAIRSHMTTSPNASVGDPKLYRSLLCIHKHPRLSSRLLSPVVRLLRELGEEYTAALEDTHVGDGVKPAMHSLASLDGFPVWLRERACGALTDEDIGSLMLLEAVTADDLIG
ncbi:hypothetical protein, unknown function [Leishmania tarentolae]|uniref:Uncharacterized protein n=1 Tax=Leishmania tarentolae TaxID=5689 RepID=A0A640KFL8_LEITA|nr:hypothetical protein, unknown function [Leishmania tarentolae]